MSSRRMTKHSDYLSGTDALRQLMRLQDSEANIVNISPRDYRLNNGIDYCCVVVEHKEGTDYSLHGYGKEAIELHEEATLIMSRNPVLVSPKK